MEFDESALHKVREDRLLIDEVDQWLFEEIETFLGQRILEIGCGLGNFARHLSRRELYVGTDTSDESIHLVQNRFATTPNMSFEVSDVTDHEFLQFASINFDTVFSLNAFEHIEDHGAAFKNVRQVLQPGGRFILVVPAHSWLYGSIDKAIGHYRRYDKASMRKLFSAYGFECLSLKYLNALGALGWFLNGRVLREKTPPSNQLQLFNKLVPYLKAVERVAPVPFGISVLAVGRKLDETEPSAGPPVILRQVLDNRFLFVTILLSVALRLAAAFVLGNTVEPLPGAYDQISYDLLAQRVLGGHGFSFGQPSWPYSQADVPTAFWSFPYTLFLAAVYALVGHLPLIARIVQALSVGVLLPWGIWHLARSALGGQVANIAALLAAFYLYFVYYSAVLMTEMFAITASVWMLVLVCSVSESTPRWKDWVALGALAGTAGLLRQVMLIPLPLMLLWVVWRQRTVHSLAGIALAAMVAICMIMPVTLRNAVVYRRFVPISTNAGFAFFWANHPVHGTNFKEILGSGDPSYQELIPAELRHLDEASLNRALMKEGWQIVLDDPIRYVRLSISRVPDFFRFWPSSESSLASNIARVLSFGVLWPFMVAGLWQSRALWRRFMPLVIFAVVYTVIHLMSWALVRYRLPVDAVLLVFAAVAVEKGLARAGLFFRMPAA